MDQVSKSDLDKIITSKCQLHLCISEPELLDRISELYTELMLAEDNLKSQIETNESINHNSVVQSKCKHYKGQHDNNYNDCTVVCDLHNDDYVSRDYCCNCRDFEIKNKEN